MGDLGLSLTAILGALLIWSIALYRICIWCLTPVQGSACLILVTKGLRRIEQDSIPNISAED
jgi:hypothetical protein